MAQCITVNSPIPACSWRRAVFVVVSLLTLLLSACSGQTTIDTDHTTLPALQWQGHSLSWADSEHRVQSPDLLALDDSMRDFVQLYTADLRGRRQRLNMLHQAVRSKGSLGVEYDPSADGGAMDVFNRGTANCLSFASLFVALAREAGLNADYQWLEVRPQWSRMGERVALRLHVNVVVDVRRDEQYMVDIDPLQARDIAGSRRLSDSEALALYHNNIAMWALQEGRNDDAWLQLRRALQLSPQMAYLWVNVGAVYRQSGQNAAAEQAYLQALQLDSNDRSAMTNLVVLYGLEGREAERERWASRVQRYRDSNPWFHAWQGQQAADAQEWQQAAQHLERAISLSPDDSALWYSAGVAYYHLGQLEQAGDYLTQAIESALLVSQRQEYQAQLDAVQRARDQRRDMDTVQAYSETGSTRI